MSDTPRVDATYRHPASPTWEVAYEGMTLLARELERELATERARSTKAVAELTSLLDGGEECEAHDQQITSVIRILEGAGP